MEERKNWRRPPPARLAIVLRVVDKLGQGMAWLAAAAVTALMVITVVDVTMRNLTPRSFDGALEWSETVIVVAAFLGLMYAEQTGANIRMTFFVDRLMPRAAHVVRMAGRVVALALLLVFAIFTWQVAWHSLVVQEVRIGLTGVPMWPSKVAVAVGFTSLAVQLLSHIVRACFAPSDIENPDAKPDVADDVEDALRGCGI